MAGDLVPNASQDQKVATGFLPQLDDQRESGVDPEQFGMEAMFDRMDAIGKGVLGLTIQCGPVHHTHKYDPITHDDYYRMFAFLNNSHEADIPVYSESPALHPQGQAGHLPLHGGRFKPSRAL